MRFAASLFFSVLAAAPVAFGQLDSLIKKNGKIYFGTITDCVLLSDPQGPTIIRSDFGALAPQGGGNWGYVEPSQNIFNFACLDIVVNFAQTNGKLVLGRSLVWHSQLPSWVSSISNSATLTSVLQNHIAQIALRYRGKIYSWIVTNEIFNDDGSFRNSVFYRTLGTNFVTIAFKAARAVDPNAKLYINDYNMDSVNNKVKAMVNFVSSQKSAGTPIDGIGSETHLSASGAGGVEAALQKLASTGCDVAITELDIAGASSSDYVTVIKACLNTPKCVGITVSGISDRETLSPNALFDSNYQKKPAYNAVIAALS